MKLRLRYNSPTILTFSLAAVTVFIIDAVSPGDFQLKYFSVGPTMNFASLPDWFRLFSHVLGHANPDHLLSNLAVVLLIGPILEEKYGSLSMLMMMLVTAVVTGAANIILTNSILLGASGEVFMMILLASFTNVRRGDLPLSFILVVLIYLLREFLAAMGQDNISQLTHIIGGVVGSIFGFFLTRGNDQSIPAGGAADKGDSSND